MGTRDDGRAKRHRNAAGERDARREGDPRDGSGISLAVFVLFFASGGIGLVYQVSWARQLTLAFGSTSLAVATVVAVFMGGLALGSRSAGKRVDHVARPLQLYGWLELSIGLYALASPWTFDALLSFWGTVGSRLGDSVPALSAVRLLVAVVLLLPPTFLMGTTLPLLSRFYALRVDEEAGRGAGLLYGINTCGAFVGTVAAGFFFLPWWGLRLTVVGTAILNVLVGVTAWWLGRRSRPSATMHGLPEGRRGRSPTRAILFVVTVTGFASLACEVVWTRMMVLILGASAYAFTVILAVFLAGLGFGAWLVAALMRMETRRAWVTAIFLSIASAAGIVLSLTLSSHLPGAFRSWYWAWDLTTHPRWIVPLQLMLAALALFGPAVAMGGILPAALRLAVTDPSRAGEQVGRLYAWNTWGSVLGSLGSGFVLIPTVGLAGSLRLVAGLYALCGVVLAGAAKRFFAPAAVAVAAVVTWALFGPAWDRVLMTSAMYYYAADTGQRGAADLRDRLTRSSDMLYYRDGLIATVSVNQGRGANPERWITINGKIDGSTGKDMPTQRLLAHIPLALHPSPRTVAIIGLGTGVTAGSAGLYPGTHVTALEIEDAVVDGAKLFREVNHAVHDRANVDIRVTDGRLYLETHPRAFDVVISEPSNPWQAGDGDLFTADFYRIGIRSLRPGGIFAQWMQLYGLSPESFRTLLRTFSESFPNAYLFQTFPGSDLILLGSLEPLGFDPERIEDRLADTTVRADLSDPHIAVGNAYDLVSHLMMGPPELRELVGRGPLHTDDHPIIYYRAPLEMLRPDFAQRNFDLVRTRSPGACAYLTSSAPGALADARARVEASYRRWRVPTPRGPTSLWQGQAEYCRRLAESAPTAGG